MKLRLLLLPALLLTACVPGGTPATALAPSPDGPTATSAPTAAPSPTPAPTLAIDPAALGGARLEVWHALNGPAEELFSDQLEEFNAGNEWGLTVTSRGYGDYPALYEAATTALESGGRPGLVVTLPEQALAWDQAGAVVDLNPYLLDPTWGLAPGTLEDIPAVFLGQDESAGRRLGLPALRSARYLVYNQTWAHELGFDGPPATAEDFRLQACAANAAFRANASPGDDGYGGWIVDTHWQAAYAWLLAFGGGLAEDSGYLFRSDPNLVALQYLKGLYDENCAWISTADSPYPAFAGRNALFIAADLSELAAVQSALDLEGSADEWSLLPFPGLQGGRVVVYGPSYTLLESSPEGQLAAWLLVRWLLSPESQARWVEAAGLLPLRSSLLEMIAPYRAASPQWEAARSALPLAAGVPGQASWRRVRYVLEDGLTVVFRNDLPADLLPGILAEMDTLAEELDP